MDLRYLKAGDMIRVERDGDFFYAFVVDPRYQSERAPEREVSFLPCVAPGTRYDESLPFSCRRSEIAGVWHADTQTQRSHRQGADAYSEWADAVNR